jgi:hypothetical protein
MPAMSSIETASIWPAPLAGSRLLIPYMLIAAKGLL